MLGEITWAGVNISSLGDVIIEAPPATNRPERKLDMYDVPGRNGAVIVPQDAFYDVPKIYKIIIGGDYNEAASALMAWLYGPAGRQRLEDSFDSSVYRRAYVGYATEIDNIMNTNGRCEIEFECDPRRFLKAGEESITMEESGTITNPTRFTSKPLITVYGSGEGAVTIGGKTLRIGLITDGMVIDCEEQNAYADFINLNREIGGSFPEIPAGEQVITMEGGITSLEIVPNWWTI